MLDDKLHVRQKAIYSEYNIKAHILNNVCSSFFRALLQQWVFIDC